MGFSSTPRVCLVHHKPRRLHRGQQAQARDAAELAKTLQDDAANSAAVVRDSLRLELAARISYLAAGARIFRRNCASTCRSC